MIFASGKIAFGGKKQSKSRFTFKIHSIDLLEAVKFRREKKKKIVKHSVQFFVESKDPGIVDLWLLYCLVLGLCL